MTYMTYTPLRRYADLVATRHGSGGASPYPSRLALQRIVRAGASRNQKRGVAPLRERDVELR